MQKSATALTSWARAIRKAVDAAGADSAALFREAGLDPAALDDPNARYPLEKTTRLWRLAVAATADPCLGLAVASQVTPTTFHALGYSLAASGTLKEAFERVRRYFRIVTDAAELDFGAVGEEYRFRVRPLPGPVQPAPEAIDAFMSMFVRMCRSRVGRDFAPLRLRLARPAPPTDCFARVIRAPVEFGAPENCLVFARADIERPLEGANPELARHNEEIVLKYLARFDKDNIRARAQAALIEQLPLGEPGAARVAAALHMSLRSLQRRLAQDGGSYEALLDATRRELALDYLRDPRYSVGEVTYLLGYSDASSFSRAFRRWTGQAPSRFRDGGPGAA